jgi:vacuolar-type H+-ATPase subunit F/Vma7
MTTGQVAAIGEEVAVQGFGLAGVLVVPADDPEGVLAAWQSLPAQVVVVILTPAAERAVPQRPAGELPLTVVMPA